MAVNGVPAYGAQEGKTYDIECNCLVFKTI